MSHLDQFPMFRFATLLARQLSSPVANRLKIYARDHPLFGRAVCARAGRWYRAGELRFKLWTLQQPGPRAPLAISDKEAIDVGTDILGEIIIFSLGALILIFEVNRQAMKQEAKKLDKRSRWVAIKVALEELRVELEIQQKEIDLLLAAIRSLDPDVPLPRPSTTSEPPPHTSPAEPASVSPGPSPKTRSEHDSPTLSLPQSTPTKLPIPGTEPKASVALDQSTESPSKPDSPPASPAASHAPDCPPPPPPPKPRCTPKPRPTACR